PSGPIQRQLLHLGGEVAHGLAHEGKLLALLVLGPKDHGVPYRPADLNLLAAFAQITVPALASAECHRTIELMGRELQAKVEQISEQQGRILALQSQLRQQSLVPGPSSPVPGPSSLAADPDQGPGTKDQGLQSKHLVGSGPEVRQLLNLV